jgi:lipocalin-like protein
MTDESASTSPTNSPPSLARALAGAWRLEASEQHLTDGTVRPSPLYGPNGAGYLIYSDSGQMCVILADPNRASWVSIDEPTEKDLRAIHEHFVAYSGRYEVNEAEQVVVHHIEMHVTPNYIGDTVTRRVSLDGPLLTLHVLREELPVGTLEYVFRWRRAETTDVNSPTRNDA